MTNINDPDRPDEAVFDPGASDEVIYRDVAAETGVLPGTPGEVATPVSGSEEPTGASATETAKANAQEVAGQAKQQAGEVASTAKDKAAEVTGTAKSESRRLLSQAQQELRDQAGQQQQRAASSLSATADELHRMADGSQTQGMAADLARQAGDRAERFGQWLADREPGDVLDEVRSFARRRPGVFIAAAAAAGVLVGRLGRSLKDGDE